MKRQTGVTTDADGNVTATFGAPIYSGRCKVQSRATVPQADEVGGRAASTVRIEIHLPVKGTETVAVGDVVDMTAAKLDAALVGKRFRVVTVPEKSYATARRLLCEETEA